MIGSIIGDIIGSQFEYLNYSNKMNMCQDFDFDFFTKASKFTDDTVLTIAVADCLMNKKSYADTYKVYAKKYPLAGYGSNFIQWVDSSSVEPYGSYGNGSAMRVSPVAYYFNSLEKVLDEAETSAFPTHNHPEGIKGAKAIAACIFLARNKLNKSSIKNYITETFGYDLERTLEEIRPTYEFSATCQETVPEAIISFLESTNFSDCMVNAVSIGGDSDTIACMAGGIAEAYYGHLSIPSKVLDPALEILKNTGPELYKVMMEFLQNVSKK